jgi:2,4-dienoyl-CoA reductase-like NADH-dependent reductase (Old Yellow Enzyme family)
MEQTPAQAIGATGNGTANCDLFPNLFTPIAIGGVTLKNRIFVTGHMTMMATDNLPNQDQVAYYEARARGGAALIVTEAAAVHATAVRSGSVIAATTDSCIAGYSHIVDTCTPAGCIVFGQLFHPGREIKYAADGSLPVAYAPSATPSERFHVTPAPMTRGLIEDVIDGYGSAAERLQRAGVAGCEIVANMGYLPAQFLNPRVNRRQDDYGGSFENRLRFLRGVVSDIRLKTSRGFVVGLRICGDEMSYDGLNVDEVLEVCKVLANDDGLDYLNVIGGSSANVEGSIHIVPPMVVGNAYIAPYAACIKRETGMITLVAGRINQAHQAELAIVEGSADMCGMTRATICDPEMPNKARAGRPDDIRACIGCNQGCIGHENMGHPISCIQRPETGRERRYGRRTPGASRPTPPRSHRVRWHCDQPGT